MQVPVIELPRQPNHFQNLHASEVMPKLNSNRGPIHSIVPHFCLEYGTGLRQHRDGNDESPRHRVAFVPVATAVLRDFAMNFCNEFCGKNNNLVIFVTGIEKATTTITNHDLFKQ